MNTPLAYMLLTAVLLAPFALVAALASRSHRDGYLRRYLDQYRYGSRGRRFDDPAHPDADFRRIDHDLDAVRTRFEPILQASRARGERR